MSGLREKYGAGAVSDSATDDALAKLRVELGGGIVLLLTPEPDAMIPAATAMMHAAATRTINRPIKPPPEPP